MTNIAVRAAAAANDSVGGKGPHAFTLQAGVACPLNPQAYHRDHHH